MAKEHLITTRELIESGWTKGSLYDSNTGCYCLDGALAAAHGVSLGGITSGLGYEFLAYDPEANKDIRAIANGIRDSNSEWRTYFDGSEVTHADLYYFNDRQNTTKADVLAALDVAIEKAE